MSGKRQFDLTVAVIVGVVFGPLVLARLWATRRIMEGPAEGVGYSTAKVVKAATA
jgi:hypothetical protein